MACSCRPLHKASWFVFGHLSADGHKFFSNLPHLWFICHNVLYDDPRMLQSSYICTPHIRLGAYFPHFHQPDFMMEDLNIQNPPAEVWWHETWMPFKVCTLLMVSSEKGFYKCCVSLRSYFLKVKTKLVAILCSLRSATSLNYNNHRKHSRCKHLKCQLKKIQH